MLYGESCRTNMCLTFTSTLYHTAFKESKLWDLVAGSSGAVVRIFVLNIPPLSKPSLDDMRSPNFSLSPFSWEDSSVCNLQFKVSCFKFASLQCMTACVIK